jgi:hypothetical protein
MDPFLVPFHSILQIQNEESSAPTGAATATGDSVATTTQNMLNLCSDNLPKIAIPVN